MNCSTICLLATYINFMRGPSTTGCGYCVDTRSSYQNCYDNILECAYRDPSSLFICLNVYENTGDLITHIARCVSYEQFYVSDSEIQSLEDFHSCKYNNVQHCECNECLTITTTEAPTTTTSTRAPTTAHRKGHHKHHHSTQHQNKYERHHPLVFHNGSIGSASAYREPQVAASSTQFLITTFSYFFIRRLLL